MIHLISGLPRSGSTLLSALLRQNPRFHAGVASPVAVLCAKLQEAMSEGREFAAFFSDDRRRALLRGLFDSYYGHLPSNSVIFDSSRSWTGKTALLGELLPEARIICCVREVAWILDSVERLVRRNALQLSTLFGRKAGGSIYSRIESLMNPDTGLVGLAWSSLREAWFSESAVKLIVIRYESLVRQPRSVMSQLYEELKEPGFSHDFDNVVYDEPFYDAQIGLPGLHRVLPRVEYRERDICLPIDIVNKYADVNFWNNLKLNPRGVLIL
jgi:sulfotransferase